MAVGLLLAIHNLPRLVSNSRFCLLDSIDPHKTSDEAGAPPRPPRKLDRDLIFSLCALVISAVAVTASLYQLRMASASISAQTWPYLTLGWSYTNDHTSLMVDNDGLGPALIREVVLTVDEKPQSDVISALRPIVSGPNGSLTLDALTSGVVIRAGHSLHAFTVGSADWNERVRRALPRFDLQICYCSVLGRCWKTALSLNEPSAVSGCKEHNPAGLKIPASEQSDLTGEP